MEKKKFFWQKKKEYYQFPLGLRILGGVWSVVWTAVKVALGAGLVALAVVCSPAEFLPVSWAITSRRM